MKQVTEKFNGSKNNVVFNEGIRKIEVSKFLKVKESTYQKHFKLDCFNGDGVIHDSSLTKIIDNNPKLLCSPCSKIKKEVVQ